MRHRRGEGVSWLSGKRAKVLIVVGVSLMLINYMVFMARVGQRRPSSADAADARPLTDATQGSPGARATAATAAAATTRPTAAETSPPRPSHAPGQAKPVHPGPSAVPLGDASNLHIMFTTDCRPYQNWQSEVLVYTSAHVGHVGHITQIISGCEGDEAKMAHYAQSARFHGNFHVHFTPKYNPYKGDNYPPYNRPRAILHWLQHSERPITEDIIVNIDPDMFFLKPLVDQGSFNSDWMLYSGPGNADDVSASVREGHAVGQQYGIGDIWTRFKRDKICAEGSECLHVDSHHAHKYYAVGPPWMLHRRDLEKMVHEWAEFVYPIRLQYKELLAEMYAYSMAAATHELPHTQVDHHMVSAIGMYGEAWPFVDRALAENDDCELPDDLTMAPDAPFPTFLHQCQLYEVGKWNWHKRHVPPAITDCDMPLFAEPPRDFIRKAGPQQGSTRGQAHDAWMICQLTKRVNRALLAYKENVCPNGFNKEKVLRLRPPANCPCRKDETEGMKEGCDCWTFAYIDRS